MIAKARAKSKERKSNHVFGPQDHGRPISDREFECGEWVKGYHYELIDGELYVSPVPEVPHDDLLEWITEILRDYIRRRPDVINRISTHARVFVPGSRSTTAPQPDVAAYSEFPHDLPSIERRWAKISPLVVVEIVSGDVAKDLTRNVVLYERVPSIQEYWVINYWTDDDFFFRAFRKRGKRWAKPVDYKLGDTYTTPLIPGFSLKLKPDV
jgi:Uma2 family endonuclease